MSDAVCSSAALVCEDPAVVLRSAPVSVEAPVCSVDTEVPMSRADAPPVATPVPQVRPQARPQATFNPVASQVNFSAAPVPAEVCDASDGEPVADTSGPVCMEGTEDAEALESDVIEQEAIARRATPTGQLYPDGDVSVNSSAVRQGALGDCYFLASVAGLADQRPQAIRNMIQANDNGTYTVTFPGHAPVTVDAPTSQETDTYAHAPQGQWVAVLEKAYAAMRRRDDLITISGGRQNISGGQESEGIEDITGHSTTTRYTSFNNDVALRDEMRAALAEGRVVTAGIIDIPFADTRHGLPDGHAYTVTGIDSDGNIMVRNPWGTGGPNGDGRWVFTPQEFGQRFTNVDIEDRD